MKNILDKAKNVAELQLRFVFDGWDGRAGVHAFKKMVQIIKSFPKLKKIQIKLRIVDRKEISGHPYNWIYPKLFSKLDNGLIEFDATYSMVPIELTNWIPIVTDFECCWKAKPGKFLRWKPQDVEMTGDCGVPLVTGPDWDMTNPRVAHWHGKGCKIHENDLVEYITLAHANYKPHLPKHILHYLTHKRW